MANRTPLYDWHVARGARLVDFAGWDMPIQYGTITDEHCAVRTGAGWFDISHMGRLRFDGPGAPHLLQRLLTNNVATMRPGQARYGLVCDDAGGILDDVLVYRFDGFWLMVVNASNREKILSWVERHRDANTEVTDRTRDWAMIAVQGPRAFAVVTALWPSAGDLKYYFAACNDCGRHGGGTPLVISRTGYTGEDGFELIVSAAEAVQTVDRLVPAAQKQGTELAPCGLGARDTLRLEAAMPLYGHELDEATDPFQAGLGWAVKMEKGDFIGRDALARRRQDPSLRRRVGLELAGKRIAREGAAVLQSGREVGRVTSGTFSPTLQKPIAMAYVEPQAAAVGTQCQADVRGKAEPARVVPMPFYRRPKT